MLWILQQDEGYLDKKSFLPDASLLFSLGDMALMMPMLAAPCLSTYSTVSEARGSS